MNKFFARVVSAGAGIHHPNTFVLLQFLSRQISGQKTPAKQVRTPHADSSSGISRRS